MTKVEDIKIINVDGKPLAVDELSQAVKELVGIYNVFRNDEFDAKHELIKVQAALRDIQREIIVIIKKEEEETENVELAAESEKTEILEDKPEIAGLKEE